MQLYLDTIHEYAAAINTLNADRFAACFAADSEIYDPADGEPYRGPAGALAFFARFEPLLESIHITPGDIRVNGNHVAFTWRLQATGKTGRTATADGIDALVFNEAGKIKTVHAYWNAGPFVAALTAS
jgi:ketosteroid isomerase-like protein